MRLTPIEWQFVELLVRNEGRLVSQRQVLVEVWARATPPRPATCACTSPTSAVPDDLMEALDAYLASLDAPPALTTVVQAALREYLSGPGYLAKSRPLRLTPAERRSGLSDVSIEHDRHTAER